MWTVVHLLVNLNKDRVEVNLEGVGIGMVVLCGRIHLLMTVTDLLDGGTDTPDISQRSEVGRGILCSKEDIGKHDMWYGVVCKSRVVQNT